jgi:hypothetical protein
MPDLKVTVDEKAVHQSLQDPRLVAAMRGVAQVGLQAAQSLAPVRTGRYRDSFFVYERQEEDGTPVAGMGTNLRYWHFIEFGSAHNAPQRVIANAALAATGGKATVR